MTPTDFSISSFTAIFLKFNISVIGGGEGSKQKLIPFFSVQKLFSVEFSVDAPARRLRKVEEKLYGRYNFSGVHYINNGGNLALPHASFPHL